MKRTIEVEFDVVVKAILRNEELSLSLTVAAPYADGERTAGYTVMDFSDEVVEQVGKALTDAMNEQLEPVLSRAQAAAHEAERVAMNMGEI